MRVEEKIVLFTSDEAAFPLTISGWKSRTGSFFLTENSARYDGCTHKTCECGKPMKKYYLKCEDCRFISTQEQYLKLEHKAWDGTTPVCIYGTDTYFFDEDAIGDYCYDNECESKDLMLVLCEPNYLSQIESDIWEDILPEDGDIPKALQDKMDELNKFIQTLGPISWSESNKRTTISL
jgi:hypothetical protein